MGKQKLWWHDFLHHKLLSHMILWINTNFKSIKLQVEHWTTNLQISTSQIIDKKIGKLKFVICFIGNGNNFIQNRYDHGILFDIVWFKEKMQTY
jgi:endonuclease III-like uncharacterized protein